MKVKRKKLIMISVVAMSLIILMFLILLGISVRIDDYKNFIVDLDNMPAADCIFVLGAGVTADGYPSAALEDRLLNAYELYTEGKSERILVSGDHGRENYDEEVYNMKYLNSREKLAKFKAFMDVEILRRKPKFEGDAIPIMSSLAEDTAG